MAMITQSKKKKKQDEEEVEGEKEEMDKQLVDFKHDGTPVSYTHLDVYKRQPITCTRTLRRYSIRQNIPRPIPVTAR